MLAASFEGSIPSRRALLVIFGLVAFALPVNLWQMRERGVVLRDQSDLVRARLAIVELEREVVPPSFSEGIDLAVPAASYLAAVDRFGSFAYSLEELAGASPSARQRADSTLGSVVSPRVTPTGERGLEMRQRGKRG